MSDVKITVFEKHGRKYASTGSKWEPIIGYSRAVRTGNTIAVTGTVGVEADGTYSTDIAAQVRRSLKIIRAAIEALGGKITDVVRTRIFTTDIARWEAVGRAHAEVFGDIRPATTLVQIPKLIDDGALIEIEADAIVV